MHGRVVGGGLRSPVVCFGSASLRLASAPEPTSPGREGRLRRAPSHGWRRGAVRDGGTESAVSGVELHLRSSVAQAGGRVFELPLAVAGGPLLDQSGRALDEYLGVFETQSGDGAHRLDGSDLF